MGQKNYKPNLKGRILAGIMTLFLLVLYAPATYANADVLSEARSIIQKNYVDVVPDSVLNLPTVDAIVEGLKDPYSVHFSPVQQKDFVDSINMKSYGIGVHIDGVAEGIKVSDVIEGASAEAAGIKAGDIIIKANGTLLVGMPIETAVTYIKGEENTTVELVLKRGTETLTITVIRKAFTVPTVEGKVMEGHIGYLKVSSFGESTPIEFVDKFHAMKKQNVDKYIVDLRNNTGGYLSAALDIAGFFIGNNIAVRTEGRVTGKIAYLAPDQGEVLDKPIFFLINEYSASASEALAAAVKDYGKAFFIGTTSFGKGVAQSQYALSDGSTIKLTIERFYSPLGKTIHKVGIKPDVEAGKESALAMALLLSMESTEPAVKTGFIKVSLEDKEFFIDTRKARLGEYRTAFQQIVEKADKVYIGYGNNWTLYNKVGGVKDFTLYYSSYTELPQLTNVNVDKKFTINFNKDVDVNTLKAESMELIQISSGVRVPLTFEQKEGNEIVATVKEPLHLGETYYFIVNDTIKGKNGDVIQNGTKTIVKVKS